MSLIEILLLIIVIELGLIYLAAMLPPWHDTWPTKYLARREIREHQDAWAAQKNMGSKIPPA